MTSNSTARSHFGGLVQCVITSFGENHVDTPSGDAVLVDTRILRNPPDDPAVRERMLHSNGLDPEVRRYVMATPGADQLVRRNARMVLALLEAEARQQQTGTRRLKRVDVHVMCGGGRHRSVAIAEEIGAYLRAAGVGCEIEHPHIDKPITYEP
ncbi:hypothetical protein ACGFMM_31530 [Streptomyces sp. NPDC048604]|uniref:RapZ C-terminal domain-containing protein n=1 Tax=Streptomyces sp. NPDC048604 TaxID=3365578 RepID=UPI003721A2B5